MSMIITVDFNYYSDRPVKFADDNPEFFDCIFLRFLLYISSANSAETYCEVINETGKHNQYGLSATVDGTKVVITFDPKLYTFLTLKYANWPEYSEEEFTLLPALLQNNPYTTYIFNDAQARV